jgi:RHS repeat-associated protein
LHDRDLGFVRFGWRDPEGVRAMDGPNHYDVRTGRWTAPDPIGDKGGDSDWYGYCLDDPVNGVDPMGLSSFGDLYDDAAETVEEALSWRDVYIGRANDGACEKCLQLDGTVQSSSDVKSKRSHPNCKCRIETCREGLESDDWKFVYAKKTRYEVSVIASNLTGAMVSAIWRRITPIVESRTQRLVRICPSAGKIVLDEKTHYREKNEYETKTTRAMCWVGGGDVSEPEVCSANNPWTGETTVVGR